MQTPKTSFENMISLADDAVTTYSVEEAQIRLQQEGVLLVDIRDIRELERDGRIVGARHVPRGMLEFWMYPDSPYYRDYLGEASEVILYCNRGWRSALAASQMKDLGLVVSHMDGGFSEWKEKNLPIETLQR